MSEAAIRKHKEKASKLISKGKYQDALDEYLATVQLDPSDLGLRQKLAESYARVGRKEDAVREYQGVAGGYAATGLLLKAIAICKVILRLAPEHTETQHVLASLYTKKQGKTTETEPQSVTMPKSMSSALPAGKKSANDIRGVPSHRIPVQKKSAAETLAAVQEEQELEDADDFDVVEAAPVEGSLKAFMEDLDDGVVDEAASLAQSPGTYAAKKPPRMPYGSAADSQPEPQNEILDFAEEAEIDADELPPIPLFSDLPPAAFIALTERMELNYADEGEVLVREGDPATGMFIIIQGKMRVEREGKAGPIVLAELEDGTFFGEMAFVSEAPRTATVVASEDTMLFEISKDLLQDIIRQYPSVDLVMRRFHRNRMLANLLRTNPLFEPFSALEKKEIIELFKSRSVESGQTLITKNQPGDGLYLLLSGRCDVIIKDTSSNDVTLAELKDGAIFGEMSMLWRQHTVASVVSKTPCVILRLSRPDFDRLIMTHPQVLETLSEISAVPNADNEDKLADELITSSVLM